MRPLALSIKGFTSFRDEQTIDFTELDLFALWGPTGSGKSSILDAITYALYGKVERVEGVRDTLTGLISHGQPRMAVKLDFECGERSYRITRSTMRNGTGKVLLERREGEDWVTHGEGADSVRAVKTLVPKLVGFDYDAFTRSVVLPQGKFAEFLVGDAAERRDILTELLGLELFGRMAKKANEIARDAAVVVKTKQELLADEYAAYDEAQLAELVRIRAESARISKEAGDFEATLQDLSEEWDEESRAAEQLDGLAARIDDLHDDLEGHADDLDGHAERTKAATRSIDKAAAKLKRASADHAESLAALTEAETKNGSLEDLRGLQARFEALETYRKDAARAAGSADEQRAKLQQAQEREKASAVAVAAAEKTVAAAISALDVTVMAHDQAHKTDLVTSLTHDLSTGDPCPVCERPLETLPERDATALAEAKRALEETRREKDRADAALNEALVAHARAVEAREAVEERLEACNREADQQRARVAETETALREAFGPELPQDAGAEIARRIDALRTLKKVEQEAQRSLVACEKEVATCERALALLTSHTASVLGALKASRIDDLIGSVRSVLPEPPEFVSLPDPLPEDPAALARAVRATLASLDATLGRVRAEGAARRERRSAVLEKARAATPEGVSAQGGGVRGDDIRTLLNATRTACRKLSERAALAERDASVAETKLEKRRELESDIEARRKERSTFKALAQELQNDRIVQFLQAEALGQLASAASQHLGELSDGRYRLEYDDDRFFVVDAWNGDEKRSVRTLSGGETFLASLALALALSEQIQMLAVTETARLESLFLDEGFGSLDAESLDVVVGAINRLGRDGRLVGLITHVPELAEAMPVRLEIVKTPRGSHVRMPAVVD